MSVRALTNAVLFEASPTLEERRILPPQPPIDTEAFTLFISREHIRGAVIVQTEIGDIWKVITLLWAMETNCWRRVVLVSSSAIEESEFVVLKDQV